MHAQGSTHLLLQCQSTFHCTPNTCHLTAHHGWCPPSHANGCSTLSVLSPRQPSTWLTDCTPDSPAFHQDLLVQSIQRCDHHCKAHDVCKNQPRQHGIRMPLELVETLLHLAAPQELHQPLAALASSVIRLQRQPSALSYGFLAEGYCKADASVATVRTATGGSSGKTRPLETNPAPHDCS